MRIALVIAGAATLVIGVVLFLVAGVGAAQAAAAFLNCLNGSPTAPMFGVPTACVNAMNALSTYQALEVLGGLLGVVGFVLLVVGIVLQPERPVVMPVYPPPMYPPPYGAPPQGPPPPQP